MGPSSWHRQHQILKLKAGFHLGYRSVWKFPLVRAVAATVVEGGEVVGLQWDTSCFQNYNSNYSAVATASDNTAEGEEQGTRQFLSVVVAGSVVVVVWNHHGLALKRTCTDYCGHGQGHCFAEVLKTLMYCCKIEVDYTGPKAE